MQFHDSVSGGKRGIGVGQMLIHKYQYKFLNMYFVFQVKGLKNLIGSLSKRKSLHSFPFLLFVHLIWTAE